MHLAVQVALFQAGLRGGAAVAGPDHPASGPDHPASGPDHPASGPDHPASGPDHPASGPDLNPVGSSVFLLHKHTVH